MSKSFPSKDPTQQIYQRDTIEEINESPEENILSQEIAAECLCLLGNTYLGDSYAYLKLDARDRLLTNIELICSYQYLQFVNLDNNHLKNSQLKVLAKIPCVIVLEISNNYLESTAIPKLPFLQALTMKDNLIRTVEPFNHENLGFIDLDNNKISYIEDVSFQKLPNLLKLSICNNLLMSTAGIQCQSLVFLYLQNNKISRVRGLDELVNLEVLHLRGNQIERLDRFSFPSSLSKLRYINLRRNKIRRVKDFRRLRRLPKLETLVCFENPYDSYGEHEEVRTPILKHLKHLRRFNKTDVTTQEWEILNVFLDSSSTDSSIDYEESIPDDIGEEENTYFYPDDIRSDVSWTLGNSQ